MHAKILSFTLFMLKDKMCDCGSLSAPILF